VTRYAGSFQAIPGWDDPDVSDRLFEKGALLYQEYERRWVNLLKWSAYVAIFLGFAAAFFLMGWYDHMQSGSWGFMGFMLFIVGMCVFVGVLTIRTAVRDMPFRVYAGGVTLPLVPFRDGLAGRETFVPASDIVEVTSETVRYPKSGPVDFYVFHRTGGDEFWVQAKHRERVSSLLREVLACPVKGPE